LVALPWYLVCYARNGAPFVRELFLKQQFQRLTSDAAQHVQKPWYYVPVLLALLLPWTPLAALLGRRSVLRDPRCAFLLALVVWGVVFFSIAPNKLPGYVLPLVPAAAALVGVALAESRGGRPLLVACAVLLVAFPIASGILPYAVESGITHAPWPAFQWTWFVPGGVAALVWWLDRRDRRLAAVFAIAAAACLGMTYVKMEAATQLSRAASARELWRQIAPHEAETCIASLTRGSTYSLNYYSVTPLPACGVQPRRVEVRQKAGGYPYLWDTSASRTVDPLASGIVPSHFRD